MAKRKTVRKKTSQSEQSPDKNTESTPTPQKKNSSRLLKKRLVMQKLRQSLTYRKKEQIRQITYIQEKRKIAEYRLNNNRMNRLNMKKARQNGDYRMKENNENLKKMKILRQDEEYMKNENISNILRNRTIRDNDNYSKKENLKNNQRNQSLRSHSYYQINEKRKNIDRNLFLRNQKSYIFRKKMNNKLKMQSIRKINPIYRFKENSNRLSRLQFARNNQKYNNNEKLLNQHRLRKKRLDESFKLKENEETLRRTNVLRLNSTYRINERNQNALRMRICRKDQSFNEYEKIKNKESKRNIRKNPLIHSNERTTNLENIIKNLKYKNKLKQNKIIKDKLRKVNEFIKLEKSKDKLRKEQQRLNEFLRYRENFVNKLLECLKDEDHPEYNQSKLYKKFIEDRKLGSDQICTCCANSFMKKSVVPYHPNMIRKRITEFIKNSNDLFHLSKKNKSIIDVAKNMNEFLNQISTKNTSVICKTCYKSVVKGILPKMTASNDLGYPDLPEAITSLSNIEERMVAPYIPFMQIRPLLPYALNPQLSLNGSIINIPVDINEMLNVLPRHFDNMSTIQIKLKRHLAHQSNYMHETIRPSKVIQALNYLVNSPLYLKKEIKIDSKYFEQYESTNDEINFIIDEKDKEQFPTDVLNQMKVEFKRNKCEGKVNIEEPNDSTLTECEDNFELNDEVLIVDRNKEIPNDSFIIAPGQGKRPLSWQYLENVDELCFPRIFGGHEFDKKKVLSYSDRVKYECRHVDGRSCNPTRILFMAKKKLELNVCSSISTCLRKSYANDNLTAKDVKDPNVINNLIKHDDGYRFLRQIRSSPAYWENKKKHAFALIRQIGVPSIFFSLSATESKNPDLIKLLYKRKHNKTICITDAMQLEINEKTELIKNDPYTCVTYMHNRFNKIITLLQDPYGPLGEYYVKDYFRRDEFQARGSVHTHVVAYCNNAPTYIRNNAESKQKCIEFIDKFITCHYDENIPFLTFQKHLHKPTCYIRRKTCRFKFPIYVMESTDILEPLENEDENYVKQSRENEKMIKKLMQEFYVTETHMTFEEILKKLKLTKKEYIDAIRSTLSRPKVFLKRKSNEVGMNAYNKLILILLESNMDIQFVLDAYTCISYMINYVTKIDAALSKLLRESVQDVTRGNLDLRQKLIKVAAVFLNANVMSTQEAIYHLLMLPLVQCTRARIDINTRPQKERVRMLKNKKLMGELEENSKDIFYPNIFMKYANRKRSMENICLAEFATKYDYNNCNKKSDDSSDSEMENDLDLTKKRTKLRVLRYHGYKLEQDQDNFYREHILLFIPWRNEIIEIESVNFKKKYESNINIIAKNKSQFTRMTNEEIDKCTEILQIEKENEEKEEYELFMQDYNSNKNNLNDMLESNLTKKSKIKTGNRIVIPDIISYDKLSDWMIELNEKQRKIVMHIYHCFKTNKTPIHIFLSGSAGVGKSKVINTLFQLLSLYFSKKIGEKKQKKIMLCAYSGKAAFLIGGVTLHSAFALPVTEFRSEMPLLSLDVANTISTELRDVELLIIDEISLVGSITLSRIDARLKQIKGINDKSFGGISILVVGDLYQIPPVHDSSIFLSPNTTKLNTLSLNVLWNEFDFYELTEIMRQKNDKLFTEALNNLARNAMTETQIQLINTRKTLEKNIPENAIRLYYQNDYVDDYNNQRIEKNSSQLYVSQARNYMTQSKHSNQIDKHLESIEKIKPRKCGGLFQTLKLKKGIKYMLINNINIEDGLVNGACGILEELTFDENRNSIQYVWLNFECEKIGQSLRIKFKSIMESKNIKNHLVPIQKISCRINGPYSNEIFREQFPLIPAEAMTIHKSQGQTCDAVVIDFTKNENYTISLLYVALSRVRSLNDLYIIGDFRLPKIKIKKEKKSDGSEEIIKTPTERVNEEMEYLRTSKYLRLLLKNEILANDLKIVYQNIRSFRKNVIHIENNKWYMQFDLLIFSETQTLSTDRIDIQNYQIIIRTDINLNIRSPRGVICFLKKKLNFTILDCVWINDERSKTHIDLLYIKIENIHVLTGYKSPATSNNLFTEHLTKLLQKNNPTDNAKVVIIGDFNNDIYHEGQPFELFLNKLEFTRGLEPNQSSTDFETLIDVIFVNKNIKCYESGIYESYFSDHKPIFIGLINNDNNEKFNKQIHELNKINITSNNNIKNSKYQLNKGNDQVKNQSVQNKANHLTKFDSIKKNVLTPNEWLGDESILAFITIVKMHYPQYEIIDPIILTNVCALDYINPTEDEDIQLIHSKKYKHWRCMHYKNHSLLIYDSLFCQYHSYHNLDSQEKLFISIRYPTLTSNDVQFKNVQQQPDSNSCGVYAAAYLVTIIMQKEPSITRYSSNTNVMRMHFIKIIQEQTLLEFPNK